MTHHRFNTDAAISARAADIEADETAAAFRPAIRRMERVLLARIQLRHSPAWDRTAELLDALRDMEAEAMGCAAALATGGDR